MQDRQMKKPIKVEWSVHDYCYYSRCPICNESITFHHAWQPDEYDTTVVCKNCKTELDISQWLREHSMIRY